MLKNTENIASRNLGILYIFILRKENITILVLMALEFSTAPITGQRNFKNSYDPNYYNLKIEIPVIIYVLELYNVSR